MKVLPQLLGKIFISKINNAEKLWQKTKIRKVKSESKKAKKPLKIIDSKGDLRIISELVQLAGANGEVNLQVIYSIRDKALKLGLYKIFARQESLLPHSRAIR
jgi:hypothetical protein